MRLRISMIDSYSSTPILNLCRTDKKGIDKLWRLERSFFKLKMSYHAIESKPVSLVKKVLGKQNYCWNGEFRYWVWENSQRRIFVSNQKGICFEVSDNLSFREAIKEYKKFIDSIKKYVKEINIEC